jgi:hypothetical protein
LAYPAWHARGQEDPSTGGPALLKVLLTPGLIAAATLLARRWGPGVGGTLAGLPLTSTPLSIFLALEQGPAFAASAAAGTLLGLLSQGALCLAYAWTARRAPWWVSAFAGVTAFLAATLVLGHVTLPLWPAFALVCGLLLLTAVAIPTAAARPGPIRPLRGDLPMRMIVAAVIVVGLTALAPGLGPTWTGLLSPFPVFALVLGGFTHRSQGPGAAARLLRGVVLGSLSHATMFVLIASLLVARGLPWTYTAASLGALSVNALALLLARRPRASE